MPRLIVEPMPWQVALPKNWYVIKIKPFEPQAVGNKFEIIVESGRMKTSVAENVKVLGLHP